VNPLSFDKLVDGLCFWSSHYMQRSGAFVAHLTIEVSRAEPSKMSAFAFGMGVTAATVTAWILTDHSLGKAGVLLLAMVFGGSMYFLIRARE
jgi:hypothetical protein